MKINELLQKMAQRYPEKYVIITKSEKITFRELQENVLKFTKVLQEQDVSKGIPVAFYLPNCIEYAYSYFAVFCLGAIGVPLDFMLKTDELISCLNHSETKVLIARSKNEVDFKKIKAAVPSLKAIILCEDPMDTKPDFEPLYFNDLMLQAQPFSLSVNIKDNDSSLIMYTSGTTGKPKGILLNYKHLDGSPEAMHHFVDLSDKDVKLCPLPLSHIGGFIYLQNCIHFGITLILMERFNPFEFLENVARFKVICFHIVPPMYNAILTLKQIDRFDLSSLRWVVVFGAPSSPEILKRFHRYCPNAKLLNGWGMTETCPPNTVTPFDSDNITSVGKPAPHCDIKIVDDDDKEMPQGEIGEIVIKGWVVMDGYYKDPETTKHMIRDGWLHTGDLGRFDKEGFLYIVGRKKEMIKVGGQIVYAPEVEAALYRNTEVAEAAVIGIPDKMKGEAVKALVVLKEGSRLSPEDLRYFAREHLANFKVPQSVEIRAALPKNRTGKIDKEIIKKELLTI